MRTALALTETSSAANPLVDIWLQMATTVDDDNTGTVQTILTNPESLSFVISIEDGEGELVEALARTSNVVTDQIQDPNTGELQPGHYAAAFGVSELNPVPNAGARCAITWTWTMPNGATGTMTREFDILGKVIPANAWGYALVSDMREEGYDRGTYPDRRVLRLIAEASRRVEKITGRFFEPRYQVQTLNGSGGRACLIGDPIIALQLVTLGNPVVNTIGPESFRIFNRHITAGMKNPDDRNNPKIEFVHYKDIFGRQRSASIDSPLFGVPFRDLFFPAGVQNVNVTGLFGYTDPDGSCTGGCPDDIRTAVKLLVSKGMAKLACGDNESERYRLLSERTRDQAYQLQPFTEGALTGDRRVDDLLLSYMRPPYISAP